MHITKNEIPTKIDVPGAVARHLPDFGVASGPLAAEYFTMGTGVDLAPLLQGLDHDNCQSAHWGYMISGTLVVTYADGSEETCVGGDVIYWPPGHSVRSTEDADVILFSPQAEHAAVIDHIADRLATA